MRLGAEFSALIDRFNADFQRPIAVAVSGGSDSLALLHLCHAWAQEKNRRLIALTVDHGLRLSARDEADRVSKLCAALQISHQCVRWDAPKPSQNAARHARYQLLAKAMTEVGASCLVTGHTLDDVVETVFMRRQRGVRGGMTAGPVLATPYPIWPDGYNLTVLRPLIGVRRGALRSYLRARRVTWMDDPSNENAKFERARVRAFFARHPKLHERIIPSVKALQDARVELDAALAADLQHVKIDSDGLIAVPHTSDPFRLLGLLSRFAGGGDRDPRRSAIAGMVSALSEPGARQTLGGAWFQHTRSGFLIGRDPATVETDKQSAIFDGRFKRDPAAQLPAAADASFLVRHALPSGPHWRELITDRIAQMRLCLSTSQLAIDV